MRTKIPSESMRSENRLRIKSIQSNIAGCQHKETWCRLCPQLVSLYLARVLHGNWLGRIRDGGREGGREGERETGGRGEGREKKGERKRDSEIVSKNARDRREMQEGEGGRRAEMTVGSSKCG